MAVRKSAERRKIMEQKEKEQLRKGLHQQIRTNIFKLGLENWRDTNKVDEYALKHYVKN